MPETDEETEGVVPNVVFPTGWDDRGVGRVDVYYGMADLRIGAARAHSRPIRECPHSLLTPMTTLTSMTAGPAVADEAAQVLFQRLAGGR